MYRQEAVLNKDFFPDEYNLEEDFDKLVMPLLVTIVNICDEYGIPMLASFQYGVKGEEAKICTSIVLPTNRTNENMAKAAELLTKIS